MRKLGIEVMPEDMWVIGPREQIVECWGCRDAHRRSEYLTDTKEVRSEVLTEDGLCGHCDQGKFSRLALFKKAEVPPRYWQPFESPIVWPRDPRKPDIDLRKWNWLNGGPWSITVGGDVGSGKSMLAAELLWRIQRRFRIRGTVKWVRAAKIVNAAFANERDLVEEWTYAKLLAVDDLGHGHIGKAWEKVAEVFATRHEEMLPTITTTFRSLEYIGAEDTGDGMLMDRLTDGLLVRVEGTSRRGL